MASRYTIVTIYCAMCTRSKFGVTDAMPGIPAFVKFDIAIECVPAVLNESSKKTTRVAEESPEIGLNSTRIVAPIAFSGTSKVSV